MMLCAMTERVVLWKEEKNKAALVAAALARSRRSMASGFKTGYTKPIKNHTSSFSTVDRLVDDQKRLLLAWTAINFSSDQATNCKGPWQSTQQFTEFHEWKSKSIRSMSNNEKKSLTLTLGLVLESFSFSSNLTKKVPNKYPEHYPLKEKMLRRVNWHLFWEIWAKVKNVLRLSHL